MIKQTGRWSKHINQFIILSIVWLSLAVRLIYLAYINEPPSDGMLFAPLCGVDAHIYDEYGQAVLQGTWPGTEPLFRTPLYTVYLGFVYALFGVNHYAPLIVQALIHAIATGMLYRVAHFIFSRQAGWLAASGFALYPSLLFYTGCFAQESLVVPLFIFVLFFLLKFQRQRQLHHLLLAGLITGLGPLGRPTVLILLPAVVAIWLLLHRLNYWQWLRQVTYFTMACGLLAWP
jgi:4-amino-4-deoxy-L-arabinose transferase-like glycosyltransferase